MVTDSVFLMANLRKTPSAKKYIANTITILNSLVTYKVNEIATYCSPHCHKSVKGGLHSKCAVLCKLFFTCYKLLFIGAVKKEFHKNYKMPTTILSHKQNLMSSDHNSSLKKLVRFVLHSKKSITNYVNLIPSSGALHLTY